MTEREGDGERDSIKQKQHFEKSYDNALDVSDTFTAGRAARALTIRGIGQAEARLHCPRESSSSGCRHGSGQPHYRATPWRLRNDAACTHAHKSINTFFLAASLQRDGSEYKHTHAACAPGNPRTTQKKTTRSYIVSQRSLHSACRCVWAWAWTGVQHGAPQPHTHTHGPLAGAETKLGGGGGSYMAGLGSATR